MKLCRGYHAIGIALLSFMLLGCSGDGNGTAQEEDETSQPEEVEVSATAEEAVEDTPAVDVMSSPVEIETEARLDNRRQMHVSGSTNLPEGIQLQVMVERESSRVRWRSSTNVADGGFEAGPFGPGSGLPDGRYLIEVAAPPANVQPRAVRDRIGERGEHLTGELVREANHGLGNEVHYRTTVELGDQRSIRNIDGS